VINCPLANDEFTGLARSLNHRCLSSVS